MFLPNALLKALSQIAPEQAMAEGSGAVWTIGSGGAILRNGVSAAGGVGSQILRSLGVSDMILLSNAPPSRYVGVEAFGLRIVGQRRIG